MRLPILCVLAALPTLPATADDCAERVTALQVGGPLDPFTRPARREVMVSVQPDGSSTQITEVLWATPTRSKSFSNGTYLMAIGTQYWTGEGWDGPWVKSGEPADYDAEEFVRNMTASMAANITEPVCGGIVDLDGRPAEKFTYRTQTDPNIFGSWWGGLYTAYIDEANQQLVRLELAEGIASWAQTPAQDVQVITVTYDPSIEVADPPE